MNWIRVTDKLPDKINHRYLIAEEEGLIDIAVYDGDGVWHYYNFMAENAYPIYWMDIPEPPTDVINRIITPKID